MKNIIIGSAGPYEIIFTGDTIRVSKTNIAIFMDPCDITTAIEIAKRNLNNFIPYNNQIKKGE